MTRTQARLFEAMQRTDACTRLLEKEGKTILALHRQRIAALTERLRLSAPIALLQRGYAMVVDPTTGRPVTSAVGITMGQTADIVFADGTAEAMFTGAIKEVEIYDKA